MAGQMPSRFSSSLNGFPTLYLGERVSSWVHLSQGGVQRTPRLLPEPAEAEAASLQRTSMLPPHNQTGATEQEALQPVRQPHAPTSAALPEDGQPFRLEADVCLFIVDDLVA